MTRAGSVPVSYGVLADRLPAGRRRAWCGSCAGSPRAPLDGPGDPQDTERPRRTAGAEPEPCTSTSSRSICVLVGLALYTVLGGADFGAGIWQLTTLVAPGRTPEAPRAGEAIREHAHHAMGPVWEANHVWLIFVLTVTWTAYPTAFGAIASTLAMPLLLAGVGIIFRGAAYALRAGTDRYRELSAIDSVFSIASVLTPFALGTMVGAIASGRVPVGNAAGSLFSSWLNPTSVLVGVLAVVSSAYMAAVYLAADAARHDEPELAEAFRTRALIVGVLAGAVAVARPAGPALRRAPGVRAPAHRPRPGRRDHLGHRRGGHARTGERAPLRRRARVGRAGRRGLDHRLGAGPAAATAARPDAWPRRRRRTRRWSCCWSRSRWAARSCFHPWRCCSRSCCAGASTPAIPPPMRRSGRRRCSTAPPTASPPGWRWPG